MLRHTQVSFLAFFSFTLSVGINHYLGIKDEFSAAVFLSICVFFIYRFQQNTLGTGQFNYFLVACILFFFVLLEPTIRSMFLLMVNLSICILYVYPKESSLRNIAFLKLFLIALVWTSSFGLFPYLLASVPVNWYLLGFLYLFFLIIALPFDIRDLEQDNAAIKTFPTVFGAKKTQLGLILLIFILWGFNYFWPVFTLTNWFFHITCFQLLIPSIFLTKIKHRLLFFLLFDTPLITLGLAFFFE